MVKSKFKIGDVLKPIIGKRTSNYVNLKDIKEVTVISESQTNYSKNLIRVCMKNGEAYDSAHWSNYYKGDNFHVYDDSFELVVPVEQDYDLF